MSNVTIRITGTGRIINLKKEKKVELTPLQLYLKELYERENKSLEVAKRHFNYYQNIYENHPKRWIGKEFDESHRQMYFTEMTTLSRIVRSLKNQLEKEGIKI